MAKLFIEDRVLPPAQWDANDLRDTIEERFEELARAQDPQRKAIRQELRRLVEIHNERFPDGRYCQP